MILDELELMQEEIVSNQSRIWCQPYEFMLNSIDNAIRDMAEIYSDKEFKVNTFDLSKEEDQLKLNYLINRR